MRTIEDFLSHYRRQRRWTVALVEAVPEEHFGWAPAPDAFTCGGLVVHLIQSENFWRRLILAAARGEGYDPFEPMGLPPPGAERMVAFRPANVGSSADPRHGRTFAECLAAWRAVQAKTEEQLSALTPGELAGGRLRHPLTGFEVPLWEGLLVFVEHEAHHRGQLSAYLKALGVPQPPVFGMS
jgi:uncharacterized damage-inducible protein DinB